MQGGSAPFAWGKSSGGSNPGPWPPTSDNEGIRRHDSMESSMMCWLWFSVVLIGFMAIGFTLWLLWLRERLAERHKAIRFEVHVGKPIPKNRKPKGQE